MLARLALSVVLVVAVFVLALVVHPDTGVKDVGRVGTQLLE